MKYDDYLSSIYYDPNHAASFAGTDKLYRVVRKEGKFVLSRDKIRDWLTKQEDYAVHREERSKFRRRRVIAPFVDYQWDVDTANMEFYKKDNDGYAFFLLAIDILSKYVWTVPLKTRTGKEMVGAFKRIFSQGRQPSRVRSDKGVEFVNRDVRQFLRKQKVDYFVTQNIVKASYAERAIKTIKSRIVRYMTHKQVHRWIDVLPKITASYNKTYHRTIKRAPASVRSNDSVELWKLQYHSEKKRPIKKHLKQGVRNYKYKIGDLVRVSFLRRPFQKEYDERWSREIFVVNERFMVEAIPQYKVKDYSGDIVTGTFYENQLARAYEQDVYKVEKVIRSRKKGGQKQFLVRWKGWPSKFDSWISEEDLQDIHRDNTTTAAS